MGEIELGDVELDCKSPVKKVGFCFKKSSQSNEFDESTEVKNIIAGTKLKIEETYAIAMSNYFLEEDKENELWTTKRKQTQDPRNKIETARFQNSKFPKIANQSNSLVQKVDMLQQNRSSIQACIKEI